MPIEKRSVAARGSGDVQYVKLTIAPPKTIPTASPTAACASQPRLRCWIQPISTPRQAYSTALKRARKIKVWFAIEAPAATSSRVLATPCWSAREAWKARGAAKSPNTPIDGARVLEAAVPRASPAQTSVDQVTLPARSEIIDSRPGKIPKPAAKSKSRASITKPRRIASHAARRSVAPRPPAGELSAAPVVCCDSLTATPLVSFLDNSLTTVSPETSASLACTTNGKNIPNRETPQGSRVRRNREPGHHPSALVRRSLLSPSATDAGHSQDPTIRSRVASNRQSREPDLRFSGRAVPAACGSPKPSR